MIDTFFLLGGVDPLRPHPSEIGLVTNTLLTSGTGLDHLITVERGCGRDVRRGGSYVVASGSAMDA